MRLVVIGGGAAGFFCAVNAARMHADLEVILIEKTGKLLSKVRISGGGRCNVTHACFSIADILKYYPRGANFVKKAFYQFFTTDTMEWFKQRSVNLKTEADGRVFPVTDSSTTIIDCLLREVDRYKVEIKMNKEVRTIVRVGTQWELIFADGEKCITDKVCIACGGYPKESMFEWLLKTGHTIEYPVPSLFTFNIPGDAITQLMGLSAKAIIKVKGSKLQEEGAVLITHWGLSGPAVLKLSARGAREFHAMDYSFSISVNWCPGYNDELLREKLMELRQSAPSQKVNGKNYFGLPQRLWEHICQISSVLPTTRWADLTSIMQNKLVANMLTHVFTVKGKTTFKEEFVTAGGIKLAEINPNTMQSRIVSGLFFAGEIMDVDGVTGGFNFQHAWTSGWIAAKHIKEP